ncbi:hypothetical protein [Sphingopyxis granuli]|uniref:hypothetical protein n=1 Tax=Sphingopyxis granuli TaxID=267128 RepID=UPI001B301CD0|nr:hypothetical protein [Sphingopyxis granuli]
MSRKGGFTPASIDALKTGSLGDPLMPGLRIAPDLTRQKLARPFDRARPLGMASNKKCTKFTAILPSCIVGVNGAKKTNDVNREKRARIMAWMGRGILPHEAATAEPNAVPCRNRF